MRKRISREVRLSIKETSFSRTAVERLSLKMVDKTMEADVLRDKTSGNPGLGESRVRGHTVRIFRIINGLVSWWNNLTGL